MFFRILPATLCLVLLSACSVDGHLDSMEKNTERLATEVERDHQYIATLTEQSQVLTEQLKTMTETTVKLQEEIQNANRANLTGLTEHARLIAESLMAIRSLGDDVLRTFLKFFEPKEPNTGDLPDIGDILGGGTSGGSTAPAPAPESQPADAQPEQPESRT